MLIPSVPGAEAKFDSDMDFSSPCNVRGDSMLNFSFSVSFGFMTILNFGNFFQGCFHQQVEYSACFFFKKKRRLSGDKCLFNFISIYIYIYIYILYGTGGAASDMHTVL